MDMRPVEISKRSCKSSIMEIARAAESSQLLRNRELWIGTESVWPSRRIGFPTPRASAAIFERIDALPGETASSPDAKNVDSRRLITKPRPSSLRPSFPLFNSAARPTWSFSSDFARSAGGALGAGCVSRSAGYRREVLRHVHAIRIGCLTRCLVLSAAEHGRDRIRELPVFKGLFYGFRELLRLLLIRLGRGKHDDKERKQQRNEIGVGYQPSFVILVRRCVSSLHVSRGRGRLRRTCGFCGLRRVGGLSFGLRFGFR